jgi:hypothetical protein
MPSYDGVAMLHYNGYTPTQRNRAQAWLNKQWAADAFNRPCQCIACAQTEGRIDAHAEDYSEPFAQHKTDAFHLCFICHMMIHCRFGNAVAWLRYKRAIASGIRYAAFHGRNFPAFKAAFLMKEWPSPHHVSPAPERRVLDEIA